MPAPSGSQFVDPNPDLSVHARSLRDLALRQDGRGKPKITRSDLTDALLEIADQLDALERPIVVNGWQPIETAPKDGTDFLALLPCGDKLQMEVARYLVGDRFVQSWEHKPLPRATHWQPLPAAPIVVTRTER